MKPRKSWASVFMVLLLFWAQMRVFAQENCLDCAPLRYTPVSVSGTYHVQVWSSENPAFSVNTTVKDAIENGVQDYLGSVFANGGSSVEYEFEYCQIDGSAANCSSDPDIVVYVEDANYMANPFALAEANLSSDMRSSSVVINKEYIQTSQPWDTMAAHEFMHLLGYSENLEPTTECPLGSSILQIPLSWTLPTTSCADALSLTNNFISLPSLDETTSEWEFTGEGCWDVYGRVVYYCNWGSGWVECGTTPWQLLGNTCTGCCYWFYT